MTEIPNLYRIILQVPEMDRAAEFYAALLSTDGRRVHSSRHYFDCGPVILALVDPAADNEEAIPSPDNTYFSVGDLEAVHYRAANLGCLSTENVHGEPAGGIVRRPWGELSFYAMDPWGNKLCFVDQDTVFTGR